VVDCWSEKARFAFNGEDGGAVGVADAAPVGEAESIASLDVEDGPAVDGADIVAAVRPCGFAFDD
jgi:hypothetical protein